MPHQGRSIHDSAPPLKGHLLTLALKEIRRTRAKHLLQWHAEIGHENILLMDEKIFSIEEQYNNQNNKIYAQTSHEVSSEGAGGHHPSYIMVWWGLHHQGATPLHFCEKDVKTGARVYREDVLQEVVKSLNTTVFNGQKRVLQQHSAPSRKAKTTQKVAAEEGSGLYQRQGMALRESRPQPPGYKLWAVLEDMAYQKCHNNLESLKRSLMKAAAEIPWRQCVPRQQSGRWVSRLALGQRANILSDIIINKDLKLLLINYLA